MSINPHCIPLVFGVLPRPDFTFHEDEIRKSKTHYCSSNEPSDLGPYEQQALPKRKGAWDCPDHLHFCQWSKTSYWWHQECSGCVAKQLIGNQPLKEQYEFIIAEYPVWHGHFWGFYCLGNQIDDHAIENSGEKPYRNSSQSWSRCLSKTYWKQYGQIQPKCYIYDAE